MPRHPSRDHLTLAQARRLALRSAGLDRRRPDAATTARTGAAALRRTVDRLGVLQIDSVNVLARAHLMPVYSRSGPWDVGALDRATSRAPRTLVEAWSHEATFVPPATHRLLGFRHRAYAERHPLAPDGVPAGSSPLLAEVRALVDAHGPVTAREAQALLAGEHPRPDPTWGWTWSVAKHALEHLFGTGELTSAGRNAAFERRYDRTDRVLGPALAAAPEPAEADARRALLAVAARAHGVGTLRCLADYWRMRQAPAAAAVDDLVEEGVLVPVHVEGWGDAYRHVDATVPRRVDARTLLSPFDPLVWERTRTEQVFGLRYRIEIYTPAARRTWGYYVLPLLLGDRLAALVDLKADRRAGVLRVLAAHRAPGPAGAVEAGAPADGELAHELVAELAVLAGWLALDRVEPAPDARGGLVPAVAAALRA
ncbi:winged helix-turn-helix domain-containing protein [Cellulomonas oligotrophica]|uniref:Cytoplasmic protein n=1 Tax=Cellulomonas oligotrophica TaxID=931536 RepID=A0A7Y9JXW9_9CELL|nr:crosslink repair DNA glycosylase YcaQ family protein [Cellulomonas oligotrophica]NYD85189.1 hypothetical protein [Cellulomonas oligotrophica]GIG34164.1 hypothetical protein Col01nite_33230 [Cellulomonas oligotrophica]